MNGTKRGKGMIPDVTIDVI